MRLKAKPWSQVLEGQSKLRAKAVVKQDEIMAAYRQGRKDFAAGRSINAPRYSDRRLDESWHRGQCDAMREKQPRLSRCR